MDFSACLAPDAPAVVVGSRRPGRKAGKYDAQVARLYTWLREQPQPAEPTNQQLSDLLGVGRYQVHHYLKTLQERQLVDIQVRRVLASSGNTGWVNSRKIWVL